MKRLLSICLVLALMAAVAVPVMAVPTPVEMDISISSVQVDAICGEEVTSYIGEAEETEVTWTRYNLGAAIEIDATIAGVAYENMNLRKFADVVTAHYYPECAVPEGSNEPNVIGARIELPEGGQSYENQLQVGGTYDYVIRVFYGNTKDFVWLAEIPVKLELCETKVESVSIAPFSYYAMSPNEDNMVVTTTWKDGTTQTGVPYSMDLERQSGLPTEIGTHTVSYTLGAFEIPVEVTVLDGPHSGQLGENITWTYDKATETMTLSGTGATSSEFEDDFRDYFYRLEPKYVVVEEGIEYLFAGIFHYGMNVESISLPTTLKEIPDALIGWNGPSEDSPAMNGYDYKGMTSITIPEGITSLTSSAFYLCWGISDYYLPSTLTEIDLDTLCYVACARMEMGVEALNTTIHFAGTEEQWAQVKRVTGSCAYPTGRTAAELEELFATFTIVFEPKDEVKEDITVEDGTATVPDSSVEITEGEDVVIDVTDTEEEVDSVVIGSETVDKITDAETSVEIKLPDATVSFDKDAIGSIGEQAGDAAVTIVATEVEGADLSAEQKAALEDKEVCVVLNLEAFAGETKITEFGGGKVTVSVPFQLHEGKTGTDYYVAHVAEDGTVTAMPTVYANGVLSFETTHFSNYVVLENATVEPPVNDNPQTGDSAHLMLYVLLMVASAACLVVCIPKRRAF